MIEVELIGVSVEVASNTPIVVLQELTGSARSLSIFIGGPEATAIAFALEGVQAPRPLTHDLFKSFCDQLTITVTEVVINDLVEGIFHAKLVLDQNGKTVEIDARSSDAIALALRFQCPIHTYEFILSAAGLKMDEGEEESEPAAAAEAAQETKNIRTASPEDLRQMLQEAIDAEDYEGASKLRDELKRREGTN